jgi:hypothetical protein
VEYRNGYSICSDCGVALVENEGNDKVFHVTSKSRTFSISKDYQDMLLTNIEDRTELAYVKSVLEEMDIPHRELAGDVSSYLYILHGRSFMGTCIYVRSSDLEAAREAVDSYDAATTQDSIPPELQDPVPLPESLYPFVFRFMLCFFCLLAL